MCGEQGEGKREGVWGTGGGEEGRCVGNRGRGRGKVRGEQGEGKREGVWGTGRGRGKVCGEQGEGKREGVWGTGGGNEGRCGEQGEGKRERGKVCGEQGEGMREGVWRTGSRRGSQQTMEWRMLHIHVNWYHKCTACGHSHETMVTSWETGELCLISLGQAVRWWLSWHSLSSHLIRATLQHCTVH